LRNILTPQPLRQRFVPVIHTACRSSISQALTDDPEMLSAVNALSASLF
jgi:hypothetical protein